MASTKRPAPHATAPAPRIAATDNALPADAIRLSAAARIARCNRSNIFRWVRDGVLQGWVVTGIRQSYFVSEADVRALITRVTPSDPQRARIAESRRRARQARAEQLRANARILAEHGMRAGSAPAAARRAAGAVVGDGE